jgi:4-alpha-glucanotransferase
VKERIARMSETLRELAEAAGLAPEYEDARGEPQTIAPETLEAVLGRLGIPAGSEQERKASLARLRGGGGDGLPPLIAADQGRPVALPGAAGRWELRLESGEVRGGALSRGRLPPVDQAGYHTLALGGRETTLAVAPAGCHWPETDGGRPWGIAAQIYGLRRRGDGGIGDYTAVAEAAEAAAADGAHALAISPVHAMFAAEPGRASPYSPSNRLLLNGLLCDPARRFGAERVAEAADALGQDRAAWEDAPLIDYPQMGTAKLALLRRLFDGLDSGSETAAAFRAWREAAGEDIENHAVFEVLHDALRGPQGHPQHWRDWGPHYADPAASAVARVREERAPDVAFHAFLQWLAEDGLGVAQARAEEAGMAIGLVADLAVGVDGGGSQAWASREDLLTGLHMGAPPDIYNAKGQDWGLAALDPATLRRSGFRAFLRMLRASLRWAGGIRIDHILGFHRVWVVPEGAPPTEGAYLHFPLDDLLRLVTLESRRHGAVVIGEDLGTVPGGLRKKLGQRGILGMSVLWFEQNKRGFLAPEKWRPDSAAMSTTHDLPTIAGWWSGRDLDWKDKLDLFPSPENAREARADRARGKKGLWRAMCRSGAVSGAASGAMPPPENPPIDAALAHVASTASRLALAPIEDLLGLREQPNLPGTIDEHPNWRRRLPEGAHRLGEEGSRTRLAAFRSGRDIARPRPAPPAEVEGE